MNSFQQFLWHSWNLSLCPTPISGFHDILDSILTWQLVTILWGNFVLTVICLKENNSVFPTSRIVAGKSMVFRNTAEVKHCAERSHGSSDSVLITTLPVFHLYVFKKIIHFWLHRALVAMCRLSLVAVSGDYSLGYLDFSLQCFLCYGARAK